RQVFPWKDPEQVSVKALQDRLEHQKTILQTFWQVWTDDYIRGLPQVEVFKAAAHSPKVQTQLFFFVKRKLNSVLADELLEAKNLLWDAANNDIIGRNTVRRNTVRGSETLKIVDDIFDALTSLNNLDATPKFAVGPEQLNRMPKASANEALPISICERINCLETQMRQLMEQMIAPKHRLRLSYSEAVQSSQHQWPNPPQPQRPRAPRVSQPTHQHTVMHAVSTNAEAHESSSTDGFQKARNKRRKRKKALIGANEDSSLRLANEPSRSVFVARFPKETKTEPIAQYATKNGITVRKVERMSKEDAPQASFRVMVKESDMMSIYNAEFWPKIFSC
ncbi:hypothetical protein CAPTEDRAFT_212951, partial [Capitella teleta]